MPPSIKNESTEEAINLFYVHEELSRGGEWLGAARRWLQSNVQNGDTMYWSDSTLVSIPFYKLEEFALKVAIAAVLEERRKHK